MAQEIADSKLLDTWGSSGTKIEPDITKIIEGWQLGEQPPHEYMNWLQNTFGSKLNHILKNGIAKWNDGTEYLAGASVQHSGSIWLCETTNTNSEPTELNANWEKVAINKDLTLTVDTLADLRSISYPANTVWASGYHTKNDGAFGSHIFRLKGVKTTETDNGGTVIIATIGGVDYVYELQYDGAVNVKWFGAKGDGVTDDTVAVQNSFIFTSVFFPKGTYLVSNSIYTPDNFIIYGEEEYSTSIKSTSLQETIITGVGYTHIQNMSIYGVPSHGRMYNVDTKGIVSRGNITLTNVNIRYFDTHFYWASPSYPLPYDGNGGGFYNKFINCSFVYGNILFNNVYGNNFSFWGCKVSFCNNFASISRGTGNFTFDAGAIEVWTGVAIGQSSGANCNVSILNTYFENRPSSYTNPLVGLNPFGSSSIASISEGTVVFDNNNIQTVGIRRGISTQPSGGRPVSVFGRGNLWILPSGVSNDLEYAYVCNSGVVSITLEDTCESTTLSGATGVYAKAYAFINNDVKNLVGFDPITKKDLTKPFVNITPINGWVNTNVAGYPILSGKVENGNLYIRGQISGTSATEATCATIPTVLLDQLKLQSTYTLIPVIQGDGVNRFVRVTPSGSIIVNGTLAITINFQSLAISINS